MRVQHRATLPLLPFAGVVLTRWRTCTVLCVVHRDAEPIVMAALEETPNTVLIKCDVIRSEYKGNPGYFYRKHPKVGLQAVPTLVRYGKSKAIGELVEARCSNTDMVEALCEDD